MTIAEGFQYTCVFVFGFMILSIGTTILWGCVLHLPLFCESPFLTTFVMFITMAVASALYLAGFTSASNPVPENRSVQTHISTNYDYNRRNDEYVSVSTV